MQVALRRAAFLRSRKLCQREEGGQVLLAVAAQVDDVSVQGVSALQFL